MGELPPRDRHQERVSIRDVEQADLPAFFEHQCQPEASAMAVARPRSREAFDEHWRRILADPGVVARSIVFGTKLVGNISRFPIDGHNWVGYWIDRRAWGRGIATEALRLFLVEVRTRPLHARTARTNAGSIRVLESNGFQLERYQRSPETERFPACDEALLILR